MIMGITTFQIRIILITNGGRPLSQINFPADARNYYEGGGDSATLAVSKPISTLGIFVQIVAYGVNLMTRRDLMIATSLQFNKNRFSTPAQTEQWAAYKAIWFAFTKI